MGRRGCPRCTAADPAGQVAIGTLNNCAGGVTPWGTVLSGEENFNQYFIGGDGVPAEAKPALNRYGVSTTVRYPADIRKWDKADPGSTPRKHTAMGRFKHEGANVTVACDGRVVAYMGDAEIDGTGKLPADGAFNGLGQCQPA